MNEGGVGKFSRNKNNREQEKKINKTLWYYPERERERDCRIKIKIEFYKSGKSKNKKEPMKLKSIRNQKTLSGLVVKIKSKNHPRKRAKKEVEIRRE